MISNLPKINSHELYKLNHRINEKGIVERRCTKCQEWKDENSDNYYYVNKKKLENKFMPECKQCAIKRSSKIQTENHGRRKQYYDKFNNKPEIIQIMRNASKKQREDGKQAEWQRKNPDKCRGYSIDRKQHKAHNIPKKQWIFCKGYFGNTCAYCGLPIEEHWITRKGIKKLGDFHKDHFNHEGSNELDNCIPSCGSCNSHKWKFLFEEWYIESNPIYSLVRLNKIINWINKDSKQYIDINKIQVS